MLCVCGKECCRESESKCECMWVGGNSVVVGLDPGESECKDAAAERAETRKGACGDIDMVIVVT